jgi:hypothetical protein
MQITDFYPGDVVIVKRSRKAQWNRRCQIEGTRSSSNDAFVVFAVHEPTALMNGKKFHRQWLALADETGLLDIVNGKWFRQKLY